MTLLSPLEYQSSLRLPRLTRSSGTDTFERWYPLTLFVALRAGAHPWSFSIKMFDTEFGVKSAFRVLPYPGFVSERDLCKPDVQEKLVLLKEQDGTTAETILCATPNV